MAKRAKSESADSETSQHLTKFREALAAAVRQAQQDVNRVSDPQVRALFETAAEVLDGLIRACDHAEQKSEPAWT